MYPLTFGVEQEHFIFKNGAPPLPSDMAALFRRLTENGFTVCERRPDGAVGAVSRSLASGALVVKNDGCTHVLEVAFPPLLHPNHLESLYTDTWGLIQGLLLSLGLQLRLGGCLEEEPPGTVFFPATSEAAARQERLRQRPLPARPFAVSSLSTVMCATHFHVALPDRTRYAVLPFLYGLEYLVPLLYSTSPSFRGHRLACARPLIYRDSFGPAYRTGAFPDRIPATRQDYERLIRRTPAFIRDYSFIVPREFGTLEFRTSCSQNDIGSIQELLAFRMAALALCGPNGLPGTAPPDRRQFYQVCERGDAAGAGALRSDRLRLHIMGNRLPFAYQDAYQRFMSRVEQALHRSEPLVPLALPTAEAA